MADEDLRDVYERLLDAIRKAEWHQLANAVEAEVALGRPVEKVLPYEDDVLEEWRISPDQIPRSRRKRGKFLVREPYTESEKLTILLELTEVEACAPAEMASALQDSLMFDGEIVLCFADDLRIVKKLSSDEISETMEHSRRLQELIAELREDLNLAS